MPMSLPAVAAILAAGVALAACGSSTSSSTRPPSSPTQPTNLATVATLDSNVTAQMVAAAAEGSSKAHEATFILSALTASGKPAANEPVSFWVGPMVPLSGVHPAHWYQAGSKAAGVYVASYSTVTDSAGHARIALLGQVAKSMEMVAAKVGNLDGFDAAAGHGVGLLDAWWTAPTSLPTAPAGDTVQVSPFMTSAPPGRRFVFQVRVADAAGAPIRGARVQFVPQDPTATMSSTMSGHSAMRPASTKTGTTGTASYTLQPPAKASLYALRVVVTLPSSTARVAGGMASQIFVSG